MTETTTVFTATFVEILNSQIRPSLKLMCLTNCNCILNTHLPKSY